MAVTVNGGAPTAPQIADFKTTFDLLGLSTAALSVKANATNATAAATDVAAGTDGHVLRRSGTTLGFGTLAAGAYAVNTMPLATIANQAATTILGNATAGSAAVTAIAAGSDGHVLRRSGTTLGFGTLATAGYGDATVTLAKMANLAQDQVIGRVTASTGVPETFTVTAAARSVLDDTTVAAMMDTLGGGTVSNTEFQYLNGVTSAIQTQLDAKLDAAIATDITDTKALPVAADQLILLDSAASAAPKLGTYGGLRTFMNNKVVGTALATTGTIDLDLSALTGTEQDITLTGNPTFTTSNRAAGRSFELRLDAGGSARTITWPSWVAFGAALPTSLASGKVLTVAIRCRSTTEASIDATSALSV